MPPTCNRPFTTRLAPSPTGLLHAGNIWSFLLAWLMARASGGKIFLRLDDLDPDRSRKEYSSAIIDDLAWLGLDWDAGPVWQSRRGAIYADALERLQAAQAVYPCFCTRQELRSLAGAPHIGDAGVPYPGTCRHLTPEKRQELLRLRPAHALRLACPDTAIGFADLLQGQQKFSKRQYGGDFPLKRSDGVWAYQLASVADDIALGVNLVVRGRDLLPSTPRQILLHALLGAPPPAYAHLPLLLDSSGERLAKRHKALSIASLRRQGASAADIVGELACLAGLNPGGEPVMPGALLPRFNLDGLPAEDLKTGMAGKFIL